MLEGRRWQLSWRVGCTPGAPCKAQIRQRMLNAGLAALLGLQLRTIFATQFAPADQCADAVYQMHQMLQARLKLEWRRFLTQQMLQAYFSRRAFFKLKLQAAGIDNPDQVSRPSTWSGRSRCQLFLTSLDHATSAGHCAAQLRCSEISHWY